MEFDHTVAHLDYSAPSTRAWVLCYVRGSGEVDTVRKGS